MKLGLRILLVVSALVLLGVGAYRRFADPLDLTSLARVEPAAEAWRNLASEALARLTIGTPYESQWQVASSPREGWITVLLVDSDIHSGHEIPRSYTSNCTYVGRHGFIVCDVALIRRFLAQRALDVETVYAPDQPPYAIQPVNPLPPERLRTVQLEMLTWVLGHEIGHIVSGHAAAHFTEARLEEAVASESVSHKEELEADTYLANQFSDPNGQDRDIYFFLVAVLNREIHWKACPDRSPVQSCPNLHVGVLIWEPDDYLRYATKGSHPEYIVRMVRLLETAHQKYDLGLLGYLNGNIYRKLLEEGASAPQ
jgi:hypothetical protein